MKKDAIIKPWDIAFCAIYFGRDSLFEYRELIHATLRNVARLQGYEFYPPQIPGIVAGTVENHLQDGSEGWAEYFYLRSGEHPLMPRYMFARLIENLFQRYGSNSDMPFVFGPVGVADMNRLQLRQMAESD